MRTLSIYHLHFKMKAVNSLILSFLTQLTIINKFITKSHSFATQNNKQQQQQGKTNKFARSLPGLQRKEDPHKVWVHWPADCMMQWFIHYFGKYRLLLHFLPA